LVGEVILGPPTELSRALLMGAAWVINLGVAEWVIRKRPGGARAVAEYRCRAPERQAVDPEGRALTIRDAILCAVRRER
jgi:hypothetical protein